MPRELVHWTVLETARTRLDPQSAVYRSLQLGSATARLGAIIHDVPYYYRRGHDRFETIAESLHGTAGEDTLTPIRTLSRVVLDAPPGSRDKTWPLVLGMLTHIAADIVFHPLVFYLTGNYHDPDPEQRHFAQTRHRLFETHLESWMLAQRPPLETRVVGQVIRRAGPLHDTFSILDESLNEKTLGLGGDVAPPPGRWMAAVTEHARYQRLFLSPALGAAIRIGRYVAPRPLRPIDALFRFGREPSSPKLEGLLEYRNPATGAQRRATLAQLLEEAIDLSVTLIKRWEPLVGGSSKDVDGTVGDMKGASLNVGVVGASSHTLSHFAPEGFPLPGLERNRAQ